MKCFGQKIRNYHCKVVLLDEQELIQEIQSISNGQELLDNVFKHLNLIETAYFGLRFIDNTGQTNWLDPGKKVIKQLEDTTGSNKGDAGVVSDVRPLRLTVHETPSHILQVLLSFAYTGNDGGALTPAIAIAVLPLGTKWGMTNVVAECAAYLVNAMTPETCLRFYAQGLPYFCPTLATRAKRYVLRHFKEVVSSEDFLSLDAPAVSDLLGDDHLNARNEAAVFEAIRAWVERDPTNRKPSLQQLLTCVRFGLMSYGYFTNVVFQWSLVDEEIRRSLYGPSMFLAQIDSLNNAEVDLSDPLARPRIPHEVVFCVGGWSAGSPTAFMETYDVRADRWFLSAHPDTTPRAYHGLVALGTHLYVVGGFDGNEHFSTVRRYDPVNKVWDERACMLFARCYVSCAALNGEIYACGGYNGRLRMASVERYTPSSNLWELVTPMNRQRSDASSASLGGRVYVAGGFTGTEVLNSVEAYDPSTAQWTFVRPMNTARSGVSLVSYRGALYALGGFNGFSRLNTAERYEPEECTGSAQWTTVPEMSSARSNFAAVCADDLLIVIGGFNGTEPFTLYFGVKFYAADPCKLLEEITRYQFFLQIKQDILQGRLPVPFDLAAELGAYAVQSELGDYDPRRHCTGYISEFRFVANQSPDLEGRITELHKSFGGQVPAVAELNYLEKVKWLDMYGVDLHPVLGEDHVDYFLGLTPSGVIVLRNKTKVGNYFWPRISKLNNKAKYFMLRVRNKSNEEQTYGFETPSRSACKHLWKCAVEHHAFFRLVQVAPTASAGNKTSTLNTRFRDSGRSESSVRRRAQPQFVRTPSRRYTRRAVGEGAQDGGSDTKEDTSLPDIPQQSNGVNKTVSVPQPVGAPNIHRAPSMGQVGRSDSPRSIRSAPWPAPNPGKSSYSVPSPRSVRSAGVGGNSNVRERDRSRDNSSKDRKRSASAESNSSVDSRTHRRRHRHSRSRKNSDNESEISRSSGKSHHSKRRHKSSSRRDNSGSESENCHHHKHKHKHKHRHSSSGKYELVDSEVQWKEAQKKQQAGAVQQAAVVSAAPLAKQVSLTGNTGTATRKSGYMNSGRETESEASFSNKRRHRRHRSKSPKERLPDELKKHIDFALVDSSGIPDDQLRQIPYVKVETNTLKSSKIRYNNSIKSNRSVNLRQNSTENSTPDGKSELPSTGDSPPPPYTPTATNGSISNSQAIDSLSTVSVKSMSISTNQNSKNGHSQSSFSNGRNSSASNADTHGYVVPPPPSRVMASNMTNNSSSKCGLPGFEEFSSNQNFSAGRTRAPLIGFNVDDPANNDLLHPSPSESPDSQKVDSHHDNSDSGLGTDHHEYYKSENFSSLGYTLPRNGASKGSSVNGSSNKYWADGGVQDPSSKWGDYRGKEDSDEKSTKTSVIKPPPTPVTSHEMSTEL